MFLWILRYINWARKAGSWWRWFSVLVDGCLLFLLIVVYCFCWRLFTVFVDSAGTSTAQEKLTSLAAVSFLTFPFSTADTTNEYVCVVLRGWLWMCVWCMSLCVCMKEINYCEREKLLSLESSITHKLCEPYASMVKNSDFTGQYKTCAPLSDCPITVLFLTLLCVWILF